MPKLEDVPEAMPAREVRSYARPLQCRTPPRHRMDEAPQPGGGSLTSRRQRYTIHTFLQITVNYKGSSGSIHAGPCAATRNSGRYTLQRATQGSEPPLALPSVGRGRLRPASLHRRGGLDMAAAHAIPAVSASLRWIPVHIRSRALELRHDSSAYRTFMPPGNDRSPSAPPAPRLDAAAEAVARPGIHGHSGPVRY